MSYPGVRLIHVLIVVVCDAVLVIANSQVLRNAVIIISIKFNIELVFEKTTCPKAL